MSLLDYIKIKSKGIMLYYLSILISILIVLLGTLNSGYPISHMNILYALFLSTIFLGIYITIGYKKKKRFLDVLESGLRENKDLNNVLNLPKDINGEYEIFRKYIIQNYEEYIKNLNIYKDSSELQNKFNNRWIHEMKTPVSVMKLIIENIKAQVDDDEILDKIISMDEEVDKLKDGLEMSLYTLRVNDFEEDFKVERVNLGQMVRDVINENKSVFILNSVYPKNYIDDNIMVISDKKWLKFVIKQIITNSIKYTKVTDKEKKWIKMNVIRDDKETRLIIEDNGIGINNKEISKVTEAFYTGTTGRKYFESTGMGLYLVREVLYRLGHRLIIESEEDEYTRVIIVFNEGKSIYELN